jgi:hypothetical protein
VEGRERATKHRGPPVARSRQTLPVVRCRVRHRIGVADPFRHRPHPPPRFRGSGGRPGGQCARRADTRSCVSTDDRVCRGNRCGPAATATRSPLRRRRGRPRPGSASPTGVTARQSPSGATASRPPPTPHRIRTAMGRRTTTRPGRASRSCAPANSAATGPGTEPARSSGSTAGCGSSPGTAAYPAPSARASPLSMVSHRVGRAPFRRPAEGRRGVVETDDHQAHATRTPSRPRTSTRTAGFAEQRLDDGGQGRRPWGHLTSRQLRWRTSGRP